MVTKPIRPSRADRRGRSIVTRGFVVLATTVLLRPALADAQAQLPGATRVVAESFPKLTAEQMELGMTFLRQYLGRTAPRLKEGARVVLVTEGSFDPRLLDMVRQVVWEKKATLDVIQMQGPGAETGSAQLQLDLWTMDPHKMWPDWVWTALEGSQVVLSAYGPDAHDLTPDLRKWFVDHGIDRPQFWHATVETLLVDAMEQGVGYPGEILQALAKAEQKRLDGAKQFRVTDPNGTDITFSAPKPGSRFFADAQGQVVVYAMHGGLIPKTTLHLETGKVVRVEGEGNLADQMRWLLANANDLQWPTAPGKGSTWLVEVDMPRLHPKIARPPWQGLHGAAKYFAFSKGYKRAGVLTVGFGTPTASAEAVAFANQSGVQIQHLDTHLYHATVTVDGKVLSKDGRPLVLDDPEVRSVAAKYGNPDQLLKIDWMPALDGR
jgi:hypothetical protein